MMLCLVVRVIGAAKWITVLMTSMRVRRTLMVDGLDVVMLLFVVPVFAIAGYLAGRG